MEVRSKSRQLRQRLRAQLYPPGAVAESLSPFSETPQPCHAAFDCGIRDEDGYSFILGRTGDVINVAGHRLGTREIEDAVSSHPGIAEVAVVGVADELEGQLPLAFATVRDPAMIATAERLDKNRIGGEAGRPGCLRFRNQSTRKQLMEAIARVTSAPEIAVQAPASI